jgi:hypothetical protein
MDERSITSGVTTMNGGGVGVPDAISKTANVRVHGSAGAEHNRSRKQQKVIGDQRKGRSTGEGHWGWGKY